MSSPTIIIVLKQKNLLYGALVALAVIAIIVFISLSMSKKTNSDTDYDKELYTAGVYSSTIILNGNPVEIKVTIDDNLIHHIDANNVSDTIATMFPLFGSCFEEISRQVIVSNSTQNILYDSENKYTSTILIDAIENAISKARK